MTLTKSIYVLRLEHISSWGDRFKILLSEERKGQRLYSSNSGNDDDDLNLSFIIIIKGIKK